VRALRRGAAKRGQLALQCTSSLSAALQPHHKLYHRVYRLPSLLCAQKTTAAAVPAFAASCLSPAAELDGSKRSCLSSSSSSLKRSEPQACLSIKCSPSAVWRQGDNFASSKPPKSSADRRSRHSEKLNYKLIFFWNSRCTQLHYPPPVRAKMADKVKGYLSFRPIEASGMNKDEQYVWPAQNFDGYVKGAGLGWSAPSEFSARWQQQQQQNSSVGFPQAPTAFSHPHACMRLSHKAATLINTNALPSRACARAQWNSGAERATSRQRRGGWRCRAAPSSGTSPSCCESRCRTLASCSWAAGAHASSRGVGVCSQRRHHSPQLCV